MEKHRLADYHGKVKFPSVFVVVIDMMRSRADLILVSSHVPT